MRTALQLPPAPGGFAAPQPATICAYEVDCDNIEDLCNLDIQKGLGVARADLSCAWEDIIGCGRTPPSWKLAERRIAAGMSDIVVPSFAPGATPDMRNVVFWSWHEDPPYQVRVIDDLGRLPRNRLSWM